MSDWLSVYSPRLTVIEQPIVRPRHIRFELAAREIEYSYFLAIDDDIFLKPSQIESLCASLHKDSSRPYGVIGLQYDSWRGMLYHNMNTRTARVDVINRVYAFTSAHVIAFHELLREAGFGPSHALWKESFWDDLFLSFAAKKPTVVFNGPYIDCPSCDFPGIALSRELGFSQSRLPILLKLRQLRPNQN